MISKKSDFASRLRKQRLESGLTQSQLAKKIGVAQNYITYLESGQRQPSNLLLKKLAKALHLPLDQLYCWTNPELQQLFIPTPKEQGHLPEALKALQQNKALREFHRISDAEIQQLASIQARGEIRKVEDYVLLLLTMRQVFQD